MSHLKIIIIIVRGSGEIENLEKFRAFEHNVSEDLNWGGGKKKFMRREDAQELIFLHNVSIFKVRNKPFNLDTLKEVI